MTRVVVLLGPPGCGKTSIGNVLAGHGFRWRDWEVWILGKWGAREEFLRVKDDALPELHAEMRAWISSGASPAVIESTGLSDATMLDDLEASGNAFVVRLDVSETEAVRRVSGRNPGLHLSDDMEQSRAIWHAFYSQAPMRRADLVIDTSTNSVAAAAELIEAALRGERPTR